MVANYNFGSVYYILQNIRLTPIFLAISFNDCMTKTKDC